MIDTVFPFHKSAHRLSGKEQGGSNGYWGRCDGACAAIVAITALVFVVFAIGLLISGY